MRAQYYEGTLQIRNPTERVLDFIEGEIRRDGKVWIAKKDILKNGYDLQMSSQTFMRNLGRKLKQKYGGELILSEKAAGRNKHGHFQSRVNVLFRLYPFRKGGAVVYRGEEYTVMELAHRVRIKSKLDGQSKTVGYDELSKPLSDL
ncbi:MAG TPA: NMD3-related protein [Candidatus Nanoarchaeia archaeon]|nr:NMD3-related protein [Candidatus Nanoarchaeia archaeon]